MKSMIRLTVIYQVFALILGYSTFSRAVPAPQSITVNIQGRILEPAPCVIAGTGDKGVISVDFGNNVMINHIDGIQYRMPVSYDIHCSAQYTNSMMLRVVGTVAGFGDGNLQTTVTDLGIALTDGTTAFPVNSFLNFNYPVLPQLYATLVKRPGVTLKGQVFSATAIMQVYYQ
ncbi:fimbrial protein [Serratia fonticola]|uniref:Fimbrial protein n=1 Tax=Serratia fonticola TaxID=47917 RepID=A0ABY9PQC0_SERFO|nr:fimbrial protein [Serratia fonticola]WMT14729.1 fimbrial protein [Serratia fonticola]